MVLIADWSYYQVVLIEKLYCVNMSNFLSVGDKKNMC